MKLRFRISHLLPTPIVVDLRGLFALFDWHHFGLLVVWYAFGGDGNRIFRWSACRFTHASINRHKTRKGE